MQLQDGQHEDERHGKEEDWETSKWITGVQESGRRGQRTRAFL